MFLKSTKSTISPLRHRYCAASCSRDPNSSSLTSNESDDGFALNGDVDNASGFNEIGNSLVVVVVSVVVIVVVVVAIDELATRADWSLISAIFDVVSAVVVVIDEDVDDDVKNGVVDDFAFAGVGCVLSRAPFLWKGGKLISN